MFLAVKRNKFFFYRILYFWSFSITQVQRLGKKSVSQTPSPFLGPVRPMSVDFSKYDEGRGLLFVLSVNFIFNSFSFLLV